MAQLVKNLPAMRECVCVKSLSHVRLFVTPWTVAHQAPLSMGLSRQDNWNGLPFLPPGDLPDPGIKPGSPALAGGFFTIWATRRATRKAHRNQSVASLVSSWLLVFPWKAPPLYITCLFLFLCPNSHHQVLPKNVSPRQFLKAGDPHQHYLYFLLGDSQRH